MMKWKTKKMSELYIKVTFALYVIGWVHSAYYKEWFEAFFGFVMIVWGFIVLCNL